MTKIVSILILIFALFSFESTLSAQKNTKKLKIDSSKIIHRKLPPPCSKLADKHITIAHPLAYYNFSSQVHATFSYMDSSNKITAITVYDFYLDDSSYFAALFESYRQAGHIFSYLRIAELKDSLEFKIDFKDTSKTFQYTNRKNCKGTVSKFKEVIENQARYYTATGRTQTLQGYLCDEYIWENGLNIHTIWVTKNDDAFLKKLRKDLLYALYYEPVTYSRGIILLSESVNLQTKNKQRFEVINIQRNFPVRFITSGDQLKSGF